MGKPRPGSSKKSESKMNVSMSNHKAMNKRRKHREKTNNGIRKVFESLRSRTNSQSSCSTDNTVILLDSDQNLEDHLPMKRKLSPTRSEENFNCKRSKDVDCSLVVYDNDCLVAQATSSPRINMNPSPTNCSTPISKRNSKTSITQNNNNEITLNLNDEIQDLTKEINRDSYVTVDLTNETLDTSHVDRTGTTVIDLENTENGDCTIVSVSNTNLSMSGDSNVTVLNMPKKKKSKHMHEFVKGIAKLNSNEKAKLLDVITAKIFSGCNVETGLKNGIKQTTQGTETAENTYIKEVILGQAVSRNSIGSNIYNPERNVKHISNLRMVVIDGSNVAMDHGKGKIFSVKGLKICIDYFVKRGHSVKAFVPRFRCKFGKSSEPRLLDSLERSGLVVYTPSREVQGRMITSYDDRYIVQCAAEFDGVIVSGDNYRDLLIENARWRYVIENRLLIYTWVNDMIMFPKDPLGRSGPTLEQFLMHDSAVNKRGCK